MSAILKKWKALIIAGSILVILAYALDPSIEFILRLVEHTKKSSMDSNPHWQFFTNIVDGYIIEFPSRKFECHDSNDVISNPAAISFRMYACVLASNDCFMVATLTDSFTNQFTTDQINLFLDKTVKGVLGSNDNLIASRSINLGSNLGREIEFQKTNGLDIKARYFKIGNRFQNLVVTVPFGSHDLQSTNVSRFFDSFNLISK